MAVVVLDPGPALVDPGSVDPGSAVPVLALPLRMAGTSLATFGQGSTDELAQSVKLLLDTRPGERLHTLAYGTPDLAFGVDVDIASVEAALAEWEPRVRVTATVDRTNPADPIVSAVIEPATAGDPGDDNDDGWET